jgi:hypothetical protein
MKFVAVLGPTTASYLASFMGGCRTGIGRLRNVSGLASGWRFARGRPIGVAGAGGFELTNVALN